MRRLVPLLAILLLGLGATRARADAPTLEWNEDHRRFSTAEYAIAGTLLVTSSFGRLLLDVAPEANFRGGMLLDDAVRDGLVASTRDGRERADFVSDLLWHVLQAFPTVVDVALVAWLIHDSFDVAWQMLWMNIEALAFVGLINVASHAFVGRERPAGGSCDEDEEYDGICRSRGRFASFLSGHTSMSFAGAGLVCAHHQYVDLYGSEVADRAACYATLTGAALVAILRIVADRHYLSDVLFSGALGFTIGYLLPVLLHYEAGGQ